MSNPFMHVAQFDWETVEGYLEKPGVRILIFAVAAVLVILLFRKIAQVVITRIDRAHGGEFRDTDLRVKTLVRFAGNMITAVVLVIAILMILVELKVQLGPIIAAAGVAGLAVSFGAQSLIKDFFTGFFILLENQFRIGDVVKIGEMAGLVEKMSLRITSLRDLSGTVHIIPNGEIKAVSNLTYKWSRILVHVQVPYREDLERVTRILGEVCSEMYADEKWKADLLEEPAVTGVEDLTEAYMIIRVIGMTKPMRQWDAMREIRKRIKKRFDAEGVEYPMRHTKVFVSEPAGDEV